MTEKLKTKEEALAFIKKRMAEKERNTPVYTDWHYDYLKVAVCDLYLDNETYRVPRYIGEQIVKTIKDKNKNNDLIPLGDVLIRAYTIKKLKFKEERFVSLSDWGKRKLLEHEPDLLKEWEKDFSPELKSHLARIRESKNNKMMALKEPERWVLG